MVIFLSIIKSEISILQMDTFLFFKIIIFLSIYNYNLKIFFCKFLGSLSHARHLANRKERKERVLGIVLLTSLSVLHNYCL